MRLSLAWSRRRVGQAQAREQLLRVRHRQRHRAHDRLPDRQARHVRAGRAAVGAARRAGGVGPLRQGAGRGPGPGGRLPARLGGEHLRHELRFVVRQGRRGAEPGRGAGRLPAEHRRGRPVALPPPRRRARLPDRHRLLRLPGRRRPLRPRAPEGPGGRGARPGARGQAQPGGQARPRRPAAGGQGLARDRRHPGRRRRAGLHQPVPPRRVLRHRQPARLGRAAGGRDRPAGGPQVGRGRPRVLARAGRPHGHHGRGSTSSTSTAARAAPGRRR